MGMTYKDAWKAGLCSWADMRRTQYPLVRGFAQDVFNRWMRSRQVADAETINSFVDAWRRKHGVLPTETNFFQQFAWDPAGAVWMARWQNAVPISQTLTALHGQFTERRQVAVRFLTLVNHMKGLNSEDTAKHQSAKGRDGSRLGRRH
jgi:hypothetical protein